MYVNKGSYKDKNDAIASSFVTIVCRNSKLQFLIAITKWFVYFSPLPLPLFFCMLGNESYLKKILWGSINEQWGLQMKKTENDSFALKRWGNTSKHETNQEK